MQTHVHISVIHSDRFSSLFWDRMINEEKLDLVSKEYEKMNSTQIHHK